jgi:hypothetical protein
LTLTIVVNFTIPKVHQARWLVSGPGFEVRTLPIRRRGADQPQRVTKRYVITINDINPQRAYGHCVMPGETLPPFCAVHMVMDPAPRNHKI